MEQVAQTLSARENIGLDKTSNAAYICKAQVGSPDQVEQFTGYLKDALGDGYDVREQYSEGKTFFQGWDVEPKNFAHRMSFGEALFSVRDYMGGLTLVRDKNLSPEREAIVSSAFKKIKQKPETKPPRY